MNLFNRRSVLETEDFLRVLNLPRRTPADLEQLAEELTAILRKPGGTMKLRPIQALALYEIGKYGGLFGPIRVGGGKTLLSLLVPFILNARRPVLLLPAALREKTERARMTLSKDWRIGSNLRILSYESLGLESQAQALTFYKPDVIIADEVHLLKNKKAGRTRRMIRYMRENPTTKKPWLHKERPKFVGMSGTMLGGGTIKSFAHLLQWALREGAPIPLHDGELQEWAEALDESTNFNRPSPGPLLKLATDEDYVPGDELTTARRAFRRRLVETPGVVSTAGDQVANCSIYIRPIVYKPNATTEENFHKLRGVKDKYPGWETPDGWPLSMAAEVWSVARQLALGFHSVWDPRPPPEWLNARKNWAAFVRETLSHSKTLDTEKQVATAILRNELPKYDQQARDRAELGARVYAEWIELRDAPDAFRINAKDVWHDTTALEVCEAWVKQGPGIVWVKHVFFGEELARRTGAPYFREKGLDARGNDLESFSDMIKAGKSKAIPIIASLDACQAGFNLQPWARNLYTCPPSGGKAMEQSLGRTHRDGQEADQVEADIMFGCVENFESWEKACAEAQMAVDTLGDSQKILIADKLSMPSDIEVSRMGGPRWSKTKQRKSDD